MAKISSKKVKTTKIKTPKKEKKSSITTINPNSAQVKNLDYFTTSNWTRVILTLDKKAVYTYQALKKDLLHFKQKKPTLYIDIKNSLFKRN